MSWKILSKHAGGKEALRGGSDRAAVNSLDRGYQSLLWFELPGYIPNQKLVLRTGYRYGFTLGETNPTREHRLLLEQTFRQLVTWGVFLSERNREEFRFVNRNYSFRYRNRVMLDREFRFGGRSISPYSSAEVFYDSRFGVWNRNRLSTGVEIHLKRAAPLLKAINVRSRVVLEPYYTRQNDSRSEPHHVNAIGLTFSVYF